MQYEHESIIALVGVLRTKIVRQKVKQQSEESIRTKFAREDSIAEHEQRRRSVEKALDAYQK
jgi:hypothetical protein